MVSIIVWELIPSLFQVFLIFSTVNALISGILFVLITRLTTYRFTWKMLFFKMATHGYLAPWELLTGTTWEFFSRSGAEIF
jgi:hypothetical protein